MDDISKQLTRKRAAEKVRVPYNGGVLAAESAELAAEAISVSVPPGRQTVRRVRGRARPAKGMSEELEARPANAELAPVAFYLSRLASDTRQPTRRRLDVSAQTLPVGRELQKGELRALTLSCAEGGATGARDAALLAVL
jgi:hypothetical protein